MKGLVVYHTKFGNGKIIAEAIARGLGEAGHDVTMTDAGARGISGEFEFVVVAGRLSSGVLLAGSCQQQTRVRKEKPDTGSAVQIRRYSATPVLSNSDNTIRL